MDTIWRPHTHMYQQSSKDLKFLIYSDDTAMWYLSYQIFTHLICTYYEYIDHIQEAIKGESFSYLTSLIEVIGKSGELYGILCVTKIKLEIIQSFTKQKGCHRL